MRSLEFTVPGLVDTILFVEELDDGTLRVTVSVDDTDGDIGDLRAVFLDFYDKTLLDGTTISGDDVTDQRVRKDAVDTVGQDANIKGSVANAFGKYDIGVEIGTMGMSNDDIQTTTFIIDHDTHDLSIDQISWQNFAVRMTSVGKADGPRSDSLKAGVTATAAPDAQNDAIMVDEDHTLTGAGAGTDYPNLLTNDQLAWVDPDDVYEVETVDGDAANVGSPIAVVSAGGVSTELTVNADGTIVFDPTADFDHLANGESDVITVDYGIYDNNGGRDSAQFTITITGVNDAPVIDVAGSTLTGGVTEIADLAPGETIDDLTTSGDIAFSDVDLSDTHTAGFVPQAGDYRGTFTVGTPTTTATTTTGTVGWSFSVNDAALDDLAAGEVLTQLYDVTVDDGNGGTATETVTVTLSGTNDAPVVDVAGTAALSETADTRGSVDPIAASGSIAFTDADLADVGHSVIVTGVSSSGQVSELPDPADLLSFLSIAASKVAGASNGTLDWTFSAQDRVFDYLPEGESVVLTYDLLVEDGDGGATTTTLEVTITGTNDRPFSTGRPFEVRNEDSPVFTIDLLANAVDVDFGETATLQIANLSGLTSGVTASGAIVTVDPSDPAFQSLAVGQVRTIGLNFDIVDATGATAGESAVIQIVGTNDAPTIVPLINVQTNSEDDPWTGIVAPIYFVINDRAGDIDSDDDASTLTYSYSNFVNGDFIAGPGGLQLNIAGNYDYLAAGETTQATATVTATDSHGAVSNESTLVWTITGANDAPVAEALLVSGDEDATISGTVTATDVDNGAVLSYSLQSGPSNGSVTVNPDGSFDYDGNADFNGSDSFVFLVEDSLGGTDTETVSITVNPVNDDPTANDGTGSVTEDGTLVVSGSFGAADVDGDTLGYTVSGGGTGTYGSLAVDAGGNWTYTLDNAAANVQALNGGDSPLDSFTVTVDDGNGGSTVASVDITVNGADDVVHDQPVLFDFEDGSGSGFTSYSPTIGGISLTGDWFNYYAVGVSGGYGNAITSGSRVGFNGGGATVYANSGDNFDLESMYATAAWNNGLQLTVSAYDDGGYVGAQNFTLNTSSPTFLEFDDGIFNDVDQVVFDTYGGVGAGLGGSGTHMAVDDMLFYV